MRHGGGKNYWRTGCGGVDVAGSGGGAAAGVDCLGAGLTGMYSGPVWPQPASIKASAMTLDRGR